MRRKYPIGIQNFAKLRSENFVYVDKTRLIHELVSVDGSYFLARPRRFGKSLLVSTLESYFSGEKNLFQGLAMEKLENEWISYPVLHFDLNVGDYQVSGGLEQRLDFLLSFYEKQYEVIPAEGLGNRFQNLIMQTAAKTDRQVVILIDEYDKPLVTLMENEELQEHNRNVLQNFYSTMKSCDRFIKFAFLTGVSRFGKLSVFSTLNNLTDISFDDEFSSLCGITEEELTKNFYDDIRALAEYNDMSYDVACDALKKYYDGYRFSIRGNAVYNPYSLLNNFRSKDFQNYWYLTGTPSYLVSLLKSSHYSLPLLEGGVRISRDRLGDIGTLKNGNVIAALYQTGYLTIKDYDRESNELILGYPNHEVEDGFLHSLLPTFSSLNDADMDNILSELKGDIRRGDIQKFMEGTKAVFAGVPFESGRFIEINYRNIVYLLFSLLGFKPLVEMPVSSGRIDLVLETNNFVYIFEFKRNQSAEQALQQISEKHYADRFMKDHKPVFAIGVNFNDDIKNIDEWKVEKL